MSGRGPSRCPSPSIFVERIVAKVWTLWIGIGSSRANVLRRDVACGACAACAHGMRDACSARSSPSRSCSVCRAWARSLGWRGTGRSGPQAAESSALAAKDDHSAEKYARMVAAAREYNRRLAATPHVIGETSGKDGTIDGDFGFKSDTEYQNLLDFGDGIMATIEIRRSAWTCRPPRGRRVRVGERCGTPSRHQPARRRAKHPQCDHRTYGSGRQGPVHPAHRIEEG